MSRSCRISIVTFRRDFSTGKANIMHWQKEIVWMICEWPCSVLVLQLLRQQSEGDWEIGMYWQERVDSGI
jgi:bacteriorhodopsin